MMNPDDMPNNDPMEPADKEKAMDMMIFCINSNIERLYKEIESNRKKCEEMHKEVVVDGNKHANFKSRMMKKWDELRNELKSIETRFKRQFNQMNNKVHTPGTPPHVKNGINEYDFNYRQISEDSEGSEHPEPEVQAIRPVTAAPKLTDIMVSGINLNNSTADLIDHIRIRADICIGPRDVQDISIKGDYEKSFKVTIPSNKLSKAVSIWPNGTKAVPVGQLRGIHMPSRQKNAIRTNKKWNVNIHHDNRNKGAYNKRNPFVPHHEFLQNLKQYKKY